MLDRAVSMLMSFLALIRLLLKCASSMKRYFKKLNIRTLRAPIIRWRPLPLDYRGYYQCSHDYFVLEAEIIKKGDEMFEERRKAMVSYHKSCNYYYCNQLTQITQLPEEKKLLLLQRQQLLEQNVLLLEAKGKKFEQGEKVEADVKNEEGSLEKMGDVKEETQAEEGGKEC